MPDLYKLAKKKARKLPPEEKEKRKEKIEAIEAALDAIPDGTAHERKKREKLIGASGPITLNVDVSTMQLQPMSMDHSKESEGFALEFQKSKAKQDEGLDVISKGLRTLKDLGHAMSDELKKQDPLLNVIDDKATDATAELRTSNVKLKKLLAEMRSPHKICLDLILVSVLLGIGSYIFTMVKPGGTASKVLAAAKCNSVNTGGCSSPPPPARRLLLAGAAWGAGGGEAVGINDWAAIRLLR